MIEGSSGKPRLKAVHGRSRHKECASIVRILVSFIPNFVWDYILPPRKQFNQDLSGSPCRFSDQDNFNHFQAYLNKRYQTLASTPRQIARNQDAKIAALQQEIAELREQFAKLLEHQNEPLQSSDYGSLGNPSPRSNGFLRTSMPPPPPPPPMPPPPPPPPLPLFMSTQVTTTFNAKQKNIEKPKNVPQFPFGANFLNDLKKVRLKKVVKPETPLPESDSMSECSYEVVQKCKNITSRRPEGFPTGDELLMDLKKVKLKKLDKTPGGGPVKKQKTKNNGHFLEEALKKRFGVIQDCTPDISSGSSVQLNESFHSGDEYHV